MRLALEQARLNAVAREFGTIVSQDINHSQSKSGRGEEERFFALSSMNVRGEWIHDIGEPIYNISVDKDFNYIVECKIAGEARSISNESAEFNVSTLSASDKNAVCNDFEDGQQIYLWIEPKSSDIHTTVCLLDQQGTVYRLFPYPGTSGDDRNLLLKNMDYILFDHHRYEPRFGYVQNFQLETVDGPELNTIFVIGSPNPYSEGPWNYDSETYLSTMSQNDFNNWVAKMMRNDPALGRQQINLRVSPKATNTEVIKY